MRQGREKHEIWKIWWMLGPVRTKILGSGNFLPGQKSADLGIRGPGLHAYYPGSWASLNQYASDSDEGSDGEDDPTPVWNKDGPYTVDWNAYLPRPTSRTDLSIADKDQEELDVEVKAAPL